MSDDPVVISDFFFNPGAAMPERDGSRASVTVIGSRRQVSIRGPAPRGSAPRGPAPCGLTLEAYATIISDAIIAAQPAAAA